ncbi:MAG: antibiotic biosynthesis monooxygenase [Bryobacteraceae bacterium]
MPFISVTRLRLRSAWHLPRFIWLTIQAQIQVRRSPGYIAADYHRDRNLAFWTKTAWKDEDSMRAFMGSGAHRKAMPVLKEMCDEASGMNWTQESAELPTWQEAHLRLQQGARYVFVLQPSKNQLSGRSDPPRAQR